MTGALTTGSTLSLAVIGVVSLAALVVGVVDILRQPGWAWHRAGRSRALYLVLVVVFPIIGLAVYVFTAREAVASLAGAGRAASLPFEGMPGRNGSAGGPGRPVGAASPPVGFGSFGTASPPANPLGASPPATINGNGHSADERAAGMLHQFRVPSPPLVTDPPKPTVPAGWKPDPTDRHQFRYWDGFRWTETVADAGVQSADPITS